MNYSELSQNGDLTEEDMDVYDKMLTQTEIQEGVDAINIAVKKEKAEARCKELPVVMFCVGV